MHPIHPALTHFPIGAWGIATGLDTLVLCGFYKDMLWPIAIGLIGLGLVLAIVTMAAGAWDFYRLMKHQATLYDRVVRHIVVVTGAWCLYLIAFILRFHDGVIAPVSMLPIILSILGFSVLVFGGWLGGDLVYGHGANVAPIAQNTSQEEDT